MNRTLRTAAILTAAWTQAEPYSHALGAAVALGGLVLMCVLGWRHERSRRPRRPNRQHVA